MYAKRSLLLTLFCVFQSFTLRAQQDSTVYLDSVIITENRLKTPYLQSARTATVLTHEMLEEMPGQSLTQVLQNVPGLDVRERGPNGVQADLSLRGGTFDQTLVLLNGIKLSDPQTGHHAMAIPLNIDNLERVEVLKGPAARVFGQNAFTGAINLITAIPDQARLDVNAYGGDFGSMGVSAGVAVPVTEGWKNYLSVSRDQSNGYRYNTDFRTTNVFLDSELEAGAGAFRLQTGYTDRQFGANDFYGSPGVFPDQYEELETSLVSLSYTRESATFAITPRIYWRRNEDLFRLRRDDPAFYENRHTSHVLGAEVNARWENALGETGIGMEFRHETIASSNLGNHNRDNWGAFLEHRFRIGERIAITPGINLNHYTDFGFNAFPGLDIGVTAWDGAFFFAQAGTSYRIPTYTDLYYEDPANLGNADLQPEQAFIYEFGMRQRGKGWLVELSFFDQFSDQLIDWTRESDDEPWQVRNLTDVRMTGIESQLTLQPRALFGRDIAGISRLSLGYTFLNGDIREQEDIRFSRYTLQNLRHQLILGGSQRLWRKLAHSFQVRWSERVTGQAFWVVDSRLTWEEPTYALFAEATNLTDTDYIGLNDIPMPGRWFRAGLRLKVGL